MSGAAERLSHLLDTIPSRLDAVSYPETSEKSGRVRSRREILGHLVDCASNHHQWLVRALLAPHADFSRYEKDTRVAEQRRNEEPWSGLLTLRLLLDRPPVPVMSAIPGAAREHTLSIGGKEPITPGFRIDDHVHHLQHHLDQILP